jgi:hypothetical protein
MVNLMLDVGDLATKEVISTKDGALCAASLEPADIPKGIRGRRAIQKLPIIAVIENLQG